MDINLQSLIGRDELEKIIDEQVNPFLMKDGGWITLSDIQGKDIWVKFNGTCASCPNTALTLENIVEPILRPYLGRDFRLINDDTTDDDLIAFARKLLTRNDKEKV